MLGKFLEVILGLIGIIIIVMVILQGGKAQGLGSTLTGTSDSNLFKTSKESIADRKANKLILIIGITFVVLSILMIVLSKFGILTF